MGEMLRYISITRLTACLLVLGLVVVQGTVASGAADKAAASWTFMVYLDGDNNLESCGVEDFMEMASVGSNAQVNIVVQFDRGTKSDASDRIEIGQSTGPGYIDSTVEKDEEYYYWVVAENGNGMGAMRASTAATAISAGGLGGM